MNDQSSWKTPDYSYGAQPGPYQVPPTPAGPPPRKRPGPFKVIGTVIGCTLGLILLIGVVASITSPATTAQLPTEVTTKAGQPATTPELPPATSAPATSEKPAAKKWVTLTKLTGSSDKASDTITTTGGRVRLAYSVKGGDFVLAAFYLLEEGRDLEADGGFPAVTVSAAGKDSTILRKAAGSYYVQAKVANARYEVFVQEER